MKAVYLFNVGNENGPPLSDQSLCFHFPRTKANLPETAQTAGSTCSSVPSATSCVHPFPTTSQQPLLTFLVFSRFSGSLHEMVWLFLLCTMSPKLTVPLTQGWCLSAPCRTEDMSSAFGMSRQYETHSGKHLQIFSRSKETSNSVSESILSGISRERFVLFRKMIRFCRLHVEDSCEVSFSSSAASEKRNRYCEASMSASLSVSSVFTSVLPDKRNLNNLFRWPIEYLLRLAVKPKGTS